MINKWFECKVKYVKTMENGLEKPVTESYLVDALTFTEAERRIIEEISPYMYGAFEISDIKRTNYDEVFFNDKTNADKWFKCKLAYITVDEKSGAEKKNTSLALVQAADLREAIKFLDEQMKGTIVDYEITAITETLIMDVYIYKNVEGETEEAPELKLITEIPAGKKTLVSIGDKHFIVDKTEIKTIVRPITQQRE